MEAEFKPWPKILRLDKNIITITEKIDGTNSCIIIERGEVVGVQSRNRLITPENDNYGFATWVEANKELLKTLGDGYHYGEWAGPGIQKNPHCLKEKTFFLFNTHRYNQNPDRPANSICQCVPVLYHGRCAEEAFSEVEFDLIIGRIGIGTGKETNPEGFMVYFHAFDKYLKKHIRDK